MRVQMFGGGLPPEPTREKTKTHRRAISSIGTYRVGGLGDGLIGLAEAVASKKTFSPQTMVAFGDATTIRTLRYGAAEFSVQQLLGSYRLRNEQRVRDQMANGYDLWFDFKPVPILRGRRSDEIEKNETVVSKLEDLDISYFAFRGEEIAETYRNFGCIGQMEILAKAYGVVGTMADAPVITKPPTNTEIPSSFATISPGFSPTSVYKSWPTERWSEIGKYLTKNGICPIQVGRSDEPQIEGTLAMTHLSLEEQMWIVSKAEIHLGSDGFLCHAASALETKAVVLWGPTPHEVWGHRDQIHVVSPIYETVWWSHLHWAWDDRCQRTMTAISVDQVLTAVEEALNSRIKTPDES